ncbi:MAG: pentapeptide repeat-containing protein [Anaerolineaceae bacterium]|nr:pentapeptide repeat-containing protein [Anaerolineaceae bacterium]
METTDPLDIYRCLKTATPERKAELIRQLMQEHPDGGIQLPKRDGMKADLSGMVLDPEANLKKANLKGAILENARLMNANLSKANLIGADLRDCVLRFSDLSGASLTRANLQNADLRNCNLQNATLYEADLRGANLDSATLNRAIMNYAQLQESSLIGAYLEQAKMRQTNFENAKMRGAKLCKAHLYRAHLSSANLMYANFKYATLNNAILKEANLEHADLSETDLYGARLQDIEAAFATFEKANLSLAILERANLCHTNLRNAKLGGTFLDEANLEFADLSNTDLLSAHIAHLHINGIHLDRTRLWHEQLKGKIGEEIDAKKENHDPSERKELYSKAKHGYQALRQNFDSQGNYDGLRWAYLKERRMEKLASLEQVKLAYNDKDWQIVGIAGAKFLSDQIVEIICNYGEGFWHVLGCILISIFLIGPMIFWSLGSFRWSETNDLVVFEYIFSRSRLFYTYYQLLLYTIDTFTTASFAEWKPASPLTRFMSGVFAMFGIFLVGLLGFVSGNRIRRS